MLKKHILRLYIIIQCLIREYKWKKETISLIKRVVPQKRKYPSLPFGKYAILIPHADDEWIGNSSLITDKQYNVILCNTNMPGGDINKIHIERQKEIQCIANKYGRKLINLNENREQELFDYLRHEKPQYILVPCLYDWHEEHFRVMDLLLGLEENILKNVVIGMYQVTVPMPVQLVTNIMPILKKDWESKWKIFRKTYKTQRFFPWYRVSCNERINGKHFDAYAAEVYSLMDALDWIQLYIRNHLSTKHIEQIRQNINSIVKLRQSVNEIYEINSRI